MLALAVAFAAGCASLEPRLPEAAAQIPAAWPIPERTPGALAAPATDATPADIGWRDFHADEKLEALIARALENNRDLRVAALNVERARGLYRVERANRVPGVGAGVSMTRSGGDGTTQSGELYEASVGVTGFELDFFGRVRNLSDAALQRFFAQESAQRTAQVALVAEIANTYLALAADRELQRVAEAALANRLDAVALTEKRRELGAVSGLDLAQAQTSAETARTDVSRYAGQVAQDVNALTLLVGAPVERDLWPTATVERIGVGVPALPAELPSAVLLRRPDVIEAERLLRAANADVGAARAAFFPSITLTGSIGNASTALSDVFDAGTRVWRFIPRVDIPIFEGGRLRGNLAVAKADRDIALARYERAIQSAFREVADALALSQTLAEQRASQEALLDAATRANALSQARYDAGRDSYLVLLDAQRTLYAAQQGVINARYAEAANRVALYRVLGGGWQARRE